jgi:predicted dehydrogenase
MSAQLASVAAAAARPLKLGFIGLGWIGRKRLDALAQDPHVTVAALADPDADKLKAAEQSYPEALATADLDSMLDSGVDGVVIATPNGFHAQQAIACLSRGVAVFCQKPLATSVAATTQVIDAARRADRLLGIDYCYRHVQGMDELRRRILAGELGDILAVDLTFHNAYGPDKAWCHNRELAGGGCLLDLGVHLVDLALWLQDFPAMTLASSSLFCQGKAIGGTEALEDFACAQWRQANGGIVRLACSWYAQTGRDAVIDVAVHGSRGGGAWRNVNGSFYDFEVAAFRGASSEMLGSHPDEWGPRALQRWTRRLAQDCRFDPAAFEIAAGARLIEAVYGAAARR